MSDILEKLGFLAGGSRFRRIYEKMQTEADKTYKEAGFNFKSSWFPVYSVLAGSSEPLTVMEITDRIAFTHITVKNIIRELESEGLIEIRANPGDKRSKHIMLSAKGLELLERLKPIWLSFSNAVKEVFITGHPDIINILKRIDTELKIHPLSERIRMEHEDQVVVVDYRPDLKEHFFELAGHWLTGYLKGRLEEEDQFVLHNPEIAYLQQGGFVFFARYGEVMAGCVALKRLDDKSFEFVKLFTDPKYRHRGLATRLISRCISRCMENEAQELWLQTTSDLYEAHKLYYKLGFEDREAPPQMKVLERTTKIMCLKL